MDMKSLIIGIALGWFGPALLQLVLGFFRPKAAPAS